jgi:hypothetical protein
MKSVTIPYCQEDHGDFDAEWPVQRKVTGWWYILTASPWQLESIVNIGSQDRTPTRTTTLVSNLLRAPLARRGWVPPQSTSSGGFHNPPSPFSLIARLVL